MMRKFMTDVAVVTALVALLGAAFECYMGTLHNDFTYKRDYMERHLDDISTLIMGSSLAENSFNPFVLGDSTYELAMSGRALYYDAGLVERYVPRMRNVRTVLLPLHYVLMSSQVAETGLNRFYIYMYSRYWGLPPQRWRDLPWCTGLLSGVRPGDGVGDRHDGDLGYVPLNGLWDGWMMKCEQEQGDGAAVELERIARVCQQKGVRLVVFTPPFTTEYESLMTPEGMEHLRRIVARVQARYPMEYKCYIGDPDFRDPRLYHNCNHLNHEGATRLAERVKRDFGL